jgi:quercetin dioxygenase-like cupin family protein
MTDQAPPRARVIGIDDVHGMAPSGRAAPYFIGAPPGIHPVGAVLGTTGFEVNALFFEAGTRSRPHRHKRDQLLYYVSGTGVVALDGGQDQRVQEGEFVLLPGGILHMHGASDDGPAVHISVTPDLEIEWDTAIPDAWKRWTV